MPPTRADESRSSAVLIERQGRFFVYEPSLGVVGSGATVEAAYRTFVDAKRRLMEEVERAGLTIEAEPVGGPAAQIPTRRGIAVELGVFLAKTCIVLVVVGALGALGVMSVVRSAERLAASIDQALAPLKSISLADVVRKAADMARDAQDLSEEKRQSLRRSVGILSREAGPIAEAWRNPPPEVPEQPPNTTTTRP